MIPLHEPTITQIELDYVREALESNWVSTGGPCVDRFELEFAKFVGRKYAISTSNGTVAIQLMLEVLKRFAGLEENEPFDVLVPTLSFIATANAVVHAGGRPVFVDCSPQSLNMGVAQLDQVIVKNYSFDQKIKGWVSMDRGTRLLAVMPAHIMGWGGQVLKIAEYCREKHIKVLEDAAESFGTFHKGSKAHLGGDGNAAAFSFNGNKIITTGGGGMVVTDDEVFAKRAKHLSTTAKTDPYRYEHDEVGFNFRLVNILAAMGLAQMQRYAEIKEKKFKVAESYRRAFSGIDGIQIYHEDGYDHNNWLVNVVFDTDGTMEACFSACHKNNIVVRPLWTPFHLQKAFKNYHQAQGRFPNAEWMWKRTLSLPTSPSLSDGDITQVVETIKTTLRTSKNG